MQLNALEQTFFQQMEAEVNDWRSKWESEQIASPVSRVRGTVAMGRTQRKPQACP